MDLPGGPLNSWGTGTAYDVRAKDGNVVVVGVATVESPNDGKYGPRSSATSHKMFGLMSISILFEQERNSIKNNAILFFIVRIIGTLISRENSLILRRNFGNFLNMFL